MSHWALKGAAQRQLSQKEIANRTRRTLDIDMDDLHAARRPPVPCAAVCACGVRECFLNFGFFPPQYDGDGEGSLLDAVRGNTRRYITLFSEAADMMLPAPTTLNGDEDVFDVLMRQARASRRAAARSPHPRLTPHPPHVAAA